MAYSMSDINQMTQTEFVTAFGSVFEDTPSLVEQTWHHRPFTDLAHLHQTMVTLVNQLSQAAQLALLRAHPDLGSRVQMAPASVQEQTSVGLNNLSSAEYKKFQTLNKSYQTKFGFPFIMAVKGQTKEAILTAFDQRLQNFSARERQQALLEIIKIARFRLNDLIA
ncbi:MAG: 2-oxo-4-hydroxy-4-carboxy-5-ureidoimidazoline decarboxylase [Cyanobacteria bacterium P01_H01_bin.21]